MLARRGRRRAGRWRWQAVQKRLAALEQWLGGRDYLEDRFTAGDLLMTTVLRILRHTDIVSGRPTLRAYQERCEAAACLSEGDGRPPQAIPGGCSLSRPVAPVGTTSARKPTTMTYIDGFVAAVPTANRDAYRKHAEWPHRFSRSMVP